MWKSDSCDEDNDNDCSQERKKPVIWLYPEKEMDISAQLYMDLTKMKLTIINHKSNNENNTWNVHSKPNGDIHLKDKTYPYLSLGSKFLFERRVYS